MTARKTSLRSLVVAAALFILAIPIQVDSACNLIPVARPSFASVQGGVLSPITAPSKTVNLFVSDCAGSAGFEPAVGDNAITLRFEPPGGSTTDVAVTASSVGDCTPAGRCRELSFETPDTTGIAPPHGLAGPARILVRDLSATVVAEIADLFLPSLSCDEFPETVFRRFTVLPAANNMADLVDGTASEILATTDGSGSLLVPFDYWGGGSRSVLPQHPGSPLAILLRGSAALPAMGAGDSQTVLDVVSAQPQPSSFPRSFTLDGRPLPPLLRITNSGDVFGTADAVDSVIRIAVNDGAGGPDLFDMSDRYSGGGVGPIVINTFAVQKRDPLPLASLRSSDVSVGYARDEAGEGDDLNLDGDMIDFVVQVVDGETGEQTNTGAAMTLAINELLVAQLPISIDTEGDVVAFIQSELDQDADLNSDGDVLDNFLRVYLRDGTDLTAGVPAGDREAAAEIQVDAKVLSVSGGRVFFRGPGTFLQRLEDGVGGVDGIDGLVDVAISPDGLHVYAIGAQDDAVAVFSRDASTGRLTFQTTYAVDFDPEDLFSPQSGGGSVVVSPDGAHVYVRSNRSDGVGPETPTVTVFARDSGTGLLTFVEEQIEGIGGVTGLDGMGPIIVSPDGDHVYVGSGIGLADPGTAAVAVFSRDSGTGALTFVGAEFNGVGGLTELSFIPDMVFSPDGAYLYVGSGHLVTFERSAASGDLTVVDQGVFSFGWHELAMSPDGAFVYTGASGGIDITIWRRDAGTGLLTVIGTGSSGFNGVHSLAINPAGTRLYVNGGGEHLVVFDVDPVTGEIERVEYRIFEVAGAPDFDTRAHVSVTPDGRHLLLDDTFFDLLGVYLTDPTFAVFDVDSSVIRPTRPRASQVKTAAGRAAYLVQESLIASNDNGDGDLDDTVVRVLDTAGPADVVTPLGVAANHIAISPDLVAMSVREADQNAILNADGDMDDEVLAIFHHGGPLPVTNVGVASTVVAVSGPDVVFFRPEAAEPPTAIHCVDTGFGECDLNADGDADDFVLHIYRSSTGVVENVGLAVSGFLGVVMPVPDEEAVIEIDGRLAAFLVSEADHGLGSLNGDGDATDSVMYLLDLDDGTTLSTRTAASPCVFVLCEPGVQFRVDEARNTVSFIVLEFLDGNDIDGDGDAGDIVLNIFNRVSEQSQVVKLWDDLASVFPPETPALPDELFGGVVTLAMVVESDVGVDLNGDGVITGDVIVLLGTDSDDDGVLDQFDSCVETPNSNESDADADLLGDTACDPNPAECPPVPLVGCRQSEPGKSALLIQDKADDTKDRFSWRWTKGDATAIADFGDPVSGSVVYSLCVYDALAPNQPVQSSAVLSGGDCIGKPCWKAAGSNGFKFKDKQGVPNGLTGMKLKQGSQGKAKVQVSGKGALLASADLPLSVPVTVQLVAREGQSEVCWETNFVATIKNEADLFKAKGP